jgi:hypothetical protein
VVSERAQAARDWGQSVHALVETHGDTREPALLRRLRAAGGRPGLEVLYPPEGRHEVTMSWEPSGWITAPALATRDEREAWKAARPETACTGTADYIGTVLGDPWLDDLKTGREVPDDPLELNQMRYYASYLARTTDRPVLVSLTHWPRYPADGKPRRVWAPRPWTPEDAVTFLNELEDARTRAARSRGLPEADARPGPHCFFCPSQHRCPELWGGTAIEVPR